MPLLAYIGGKPAAFTSKDHNFLAGETAEKQLILINNSRVEVTADCEWSFDTPQPVSGTVDGHRSARRPEAPSPEVRTAGGSRAQAIHSLKPAVEFRQRRNPEGFLRDRRPAAARGSAGDGRRSRSSIPRARRVKLLDGMGVRGEPVDANASVSEYDTLIIGKGSADLAGRGAEPQRRSRRPEGRHLRADRRGARKTVRIPDRGIWAALGLQARARSSAAGRHCGRAPAQLARRLDHAAPAPELRAFPAIQRRHPR